MGKEMPDIRTSDYLKKDDVMTLLRVLDFSMSREEIASRMSELPTIKLSENDLNMVEYGRLVRRAENI